MDAFKLLTRSTKLKPSSTISSRLPSAGKAENPQLFRSDEDTYSKKRKRHEAASHDSENDDDLEMDFFGSVKRASSSKDSASKEPKRQRGAKNGIVEDEDASDSDDQVEVVAMDESERRSILKTHKIKVTDLRDLEEIQSANRSEDGEKKRKKKKKDKVSPVLSKKQQKEARRLYPEPLTSFQALRRKYRISRRLAENIAEQGFSVPTEVQMGSLPLMIGNSSYSSKTASGNQEPDLLVVAPTGSGKTLAFLLPLINKIVRLHHEHPGQRGIHALVVAPTKELVAQIVNEGRKLTVGTGVKITGMRKGMQVLDRPEGKEEPTEKEEEGTSDSESDKQETTGTEKSHRKSTVTKSDILVTTPLILVHALSANQAKSVSPLLSVRYLVLDEADVLLDPLFRDQTSALWGACTNPQLRMSLWSATMGSNIEELAKTTIKERQTSLGIVETAPLVRVVIGLKDSAVPNIKHKLIYAATEQGKLLGLRQLIHPTASIAPKETRLRPPFLIFTQTIPRAVALHSELLYDIPAEAGGSSRIAVLHADLSETRRSEIMRGFRKGEIWIIVTTDLLARGVDFRGINGVVNYDIPTSSAAYVHRVGRTGRAGRGGGVAVTFYTKEDIPYVKSIANLIDTSEKLQGKTEDKSVQKWLLDALPDLSKKDRQDLKRHGVRARQSSAKLTAAGKDARAQRKSRISTKSGFDRRMESKRKGAIAGNRNKATAVAADSGDEWEGIE
jgi:ATP-dependent RNA helicase DDX52/ROK1